jgi:hypothetical protein
MASKTLLVRIETCQVRAASEIYQSVAICFSEGFDAATASFWDGTRHWAAERRR